MKELLTKELCDDPRSILVIEYYDEKPHSVTLSDDKHSQDDYDFNYSKCSDLMYYHNTGGRGKSNHYAVNRLREGTRQKIWVRHNIIFTMNDITQNVLTHEQVKEMGWDIIEDPLVIKDRVYEDSRDPFKNAQEGDTEYCEKCDDNNLKDGDILCNHMKWCEGRCEWWTIHEDDACVECGNKWREE